MKQDLYVLLIEDSPSDEKLIASALRKAFNAEINRVEKCEDFQEELQKKIPDIILSDYNLPEFDGLSALRMRNEKAPLVPFIFVTGALSEETAVELIKTGADDYILKDNLKRLCAAIDSAISKMENLKDKIRAESDLRESEEYYRKLTENFPNGTVTVYDKALNMVFVAGQDLKKYNATPDQYLGKNFREIAPAETFEIARPHLENAFKGISGHYETPYWDNRFYEVNVTPLKDIDGTINQIMVVSQNVTEQVTAKKNLVETEEKLREILEHSVNLFYSHDVNGVITYVSPQSKQYLGCEPKEAMIHWTEFITDNPVNLLGIENTNKAIETGIRQPRYELELKKKNGEKIWVEVGETPVVKEGKTVSIVGSLTDITEKKLAEDKIKEAYIQLNNLYNNLPEAIFSVDIANNKMLQVSQAHLKVFGHSSEEFLKNPTLIYDLIIPEDKHIIDDGNSILLKGKIFECEYRIMKSNGEINWIASRMNPTLSKEGKLIRIDGIASNITEKRKIQEALNESEKKYRNLVENINDIVYSVDEKGVIIFVSHAVNRSLGFDPGEMVGRNFAEFIHPDDLNNALENFSVISDKKTNLAEYRIRTNSGDFRTMTVSSTAIFKDSVFIGVTGVLVDITEKKKVQEQLKFQSHLLDEIGEAIMATDLEGKITYWNRGAEHLYGWKNEEVIDKNIIDVTPTDSSAEQAKEIFGKLTLGESWTGEFNVKRKDGTTFPAAVTDSPVFDKNNKLVGIIGISNDITERKKFEKELVDAKEKAEETNRLKSSFLANMSHELRTPLVGILGFAEILTYNSIDSEQLEMVKTILKSGNRLMNTLNSILDLSRIEANKQDIKLAEFDLTKLISESVELFTAAAQEKGLSIKLNRSHNEIKMISDADLVRKIVENLISNAVKYTDDGSINVNVSFLKNGTDSSVKIDVIDTGIGISEKQCELVFEPFRQVSEGYARKFEGSGLGLSITKKFVELLNGNILFESEPGKGSIFTVTLPASLDDVKSADSQNKITPETKYKASQSSKNSKVLLVEDDIINASVVSAYLHGFVFVEHAINANEAVQKCILEKYNAILMDINLNGKNGIEALKEIRELNDFYKHVPAIAMTAYAMKGDKERFLSEGFDYYLSKPFNRNDILKLMERVL